jgi:hypothetical protein
MRKLLDMEQCAYGLRRRAVQILLPIGERVAAWIGSVVEGHDVYRHRTPRMGYPFKLKGAAIGDGAVVLVQSGDLLELGP